MTLNKLVSKVTTTTQEQSNNLTSLLIQFLDSIRRDIQVHLPESSSFMHIKALDIINRAQKPSMSIVANELNITSPGTTMIVDKLCENGELERAHDLADRRIVRLKMTAKGRATLKRGMKEIHTVIGKKMSALSTVESQQFGQLLQKLI